jgi:tripartite-type tricarboxylate transporter receptor subunit TctC
VKLNRRSTLAGVAALSAAPRAFAQTFPDKPIKIVVPFAAGSATDLTARGLGAKLQEILKQPIIVDDRPGASGQLGAAAVATAPADGYTLLMGTNSTNAARIVEAVTGSETMLASSRWSPWSGTVMDAPATNPAPIVVSVSISAAWT